MTHCTMVATDCCESAVRADIPEPGKLARPERGWRLAPLHFNPRSSGGLRPCVPENMQQRVALQVRRRVRPTLAQFAHRK